MRIQFLRSGSASALFLALVAAGCKDLTGNPGVPSGTSSPTAYNTPAGALGMRNSAILVYQTALARYVMDAGLLSDELEDPTLLGIGLSAGDESTNALDLRTLPASQTTTGTAFAGSDGDYDNLQGVRQFTNQAIGALAMYDTAYTSDSLGAAKVRTGTILRGELWALQGYAEIMLADLFCSGVPLSTFDFNQDFTYRAGSTTSEVYADALAKFDSALVLAHDSAAIVNLARVGKGRALLDLGLYDSAAAVVATVPDTFRYTRQGTLRIDQPYDPDTYEPLPLYCISRFGYGDCKAAFADMEGHNGVPFLSSADPRIAGALGPAGYPVKYQAGLVGTGTTGTVSIVVADGIEARLIRAEAALHNPGRWGNWVTPLNALRQTAMVTGQTTSLAPLSDPGSDTARVSLVFRERAYWLYLTGHRQGDLRRLVRNYQRPQASVYPSGAYIGALITQYGSDVTAPIPASEQANPLSQGCYDRRA